MPKAKPTDESGEAKPVTLSKGRYAIYQSPSGDGVISYRPDGVDADQHQVVPAKFWGMLLGVLSGEIKDLNPVQIMRMIVGGGK